MLKLKLLQPEILGRLAAMGHGSQVLVADGNYPVATGAQPAAQRVYLNLAPGLVTVPQVLAALTSVAHFEAACVMFPPDGTPQPIHEEFRQLLPAGVAFTGANRQAFYEQAKGADVALVIATGETRRFANLLLTMGVIKEAGS